MTTFRSESAVAGIIALAAVPLIVWILMRARREQRLPIGRTYVNRYERPGAFRTLSAFYVAAAVGLGWIGLDLLFGFTAR